MFSIRERRLAAVLDRRVGERPLSRFVPTAPGGEGVSREVLEVAGNQILEEGALAALNDDHKAFLVMRWLWRLANFADLFWSLMVFKARSTIGGVSTKQFRVRFGQSCLLFLFSTAGLIES